MEQEMSRDSGYEFIATINEAHKIDLVIERRTRKVCVRKILDVYSPEIYRFLQMHPVTGIPAILHLEEENGRLTVIEEYIQGTTLRELIDSSSLTPERILAFFINLCEILQPLHSNGQPLVHRDIKPTNIMITHYDKVMLLDFNAARYYSNGPGRESDTVLLGTQGYAAPEQYGFGESSPKTDIYSLGIVLKEAAASLREPTRIFDPIIEKCTRIDPHHRYDSVEELKSALMRLTEPGTDVRTAGSFTGRARLRFLPPGFRSLTPWKMIIAACGYILLVYLCLTSSIQGKSGAALWTERVIMLFVFLGSIFAGFDYLGIRGNFLFGRHRNLLLRIAGGAVLIVLYIFIMMVILSFIETVFFPG